MSELIPIREAARRIGVSDTAVHKAIKAGRVFVAGNNPKNGRPLVEWPKVADDWKANSADHKRTHVGGNGESQERKKYATSGPEIVLPVANRPAEADPKDPPAGMPSYNESRAAREYHQAELARLEVEEKTGKLIDAVEVEKSGRRLAAAVISGLYTIPDRISDELAGMNDANEIQALLIAEIDRTVGDLRAKYAA